eukprot:11523842-Karenia_brevis.AAC.1
MDSIEAATLAATKCVVEVAVEKLTAHIVPVRSIFIGNPLGTSFQATLLDWLRDLGQAQPMAHASHELAIIQPQTCTGWCCFHPIADTSLAREQSCCVPPLPLVGVLGMTDFKKSISFNPGEGSQ